MRKMNSAVNLRVHHDVGRPSTDILKSKCYAIRNKYPKAASAVQQLHTVLRDIGNFAGCTPIKMGESSEWTSIVNSTDNRANFCKALDRKPFLALFTACTR
jgi:hypothetical protein